MEAIELYKSIEHMDNNQQLSVRYLKKIIVGIIDDKFEKSKGIGYIHRDYLEAHSEFMKKAIENYNK